MRALFTVLQKKRKPKLQHVRKFSAPVKYLPNATLESFERWLRLLTCVFKMCRNIALTCLKSGQRYFSPAQVGDQRKVPLWSPLGSTPKTTVRRERFPGTLWDKSRAGTIPKYINKFSRLKLNTAVPFSGAMFFQWLIWSYLWSFRTFDKSKCRVMHSMTL